MGYDLHITRRDFCAVEGRGDSITLDEWKRYIARHLNAKVQGDDGETYAEDGTIVDADVSVGHSLSNTQDERQEPKRPWWKYW